MSDEQKNVYPSIFKKSMLLNEEKTNLLKSRKKDMTSDLYSIINNLKEKKDIDDFIKSKLDAIAKNKIFFSDLKDNKGKFTLFFLVKIIGFLFLTSNIVGIFQIIGIQESLEEEIFDSIKLYFNGNNSTNITTIDFYHKVYSNNTKKLPGISFFFILSFLSDIIIKLLNFPILTVVMLVLNSVVFYFLYNFDFLEGEKLNENYSLFNFFLLVLYLFYFSLILGIVALLPFNIFTAGYFYYEQNLMRQIKNKNEINNNNIINNDNDKNDIIIKDDNDNDKKNVKNISVIKYSVDNDNKVNNTKKENVSDIYVRDSSSFFLEVNDVQREKIKEPENKEIEMPKKNGYYISYVLAFLIGITVRLYSNTEDIIYDHKRLFINLIYFHYIPIVMSLFFYIIFSCAFSKKSNIKSEVCIAQFCGYFIFQETKERKKSICCGGCRTGFRKFNKCFCCCCNCNCLNCETCCPCLPLSECCKGKDDLTEIEDRDKSLCICYKVKGKCSWICDYFIDYYVFESVLIIAFVELYNFGFKSILNEYIRDLDYQRNYDNAEINNKMLIIHIIYLVGIFSYYIFNIIFGKMFYSAIPYVNVAFNGEGFIIGLGLLFVAIFESINSCIFSGLIYYDHVEDYKFYLMAFSIGSTEYIKVLTINLIGKDFNDSNLFTSSTFISIFLTVLKAFLSLFDNLVTDHINFILFQFIFGLITGFFGCCITCCMMLTKKIITKSEEIMKEQEELEKKLEEEKKELLEKKAVIELYERLKKNDGHLDEGLNINDE